MIFVENEQGALIELAGTGMNGGSATFENMAPGMGTIGALCVFLLVCFEHELIVFLFLCFRCTVD